MSAAELADRLTAVMAVLPDFGSDLNGVEVHRRTSPNPYSRLSADVQLSVYAEGEACERYAAAILKTHPDTQLEHHGKAFSLWCKGSPSWSIYFSESVCVRVQTGTVTVTKPAPDAPTIEVEEPVYEWRCADPILAALPTPAVTP